MPDLKKDFFTAVNVLSRFGGFLHQIHYGILNTKLENGEINNDNKRNVRTCS